MKTVLVIFVLSLLWNDIVSQSCTTPLNRRSQCISLYDCPQLLSAFEQNPLPSQYISFLKQSQCGFDGFVPTVCCGPLPSSSPRTTTTSRPIWSSGDTDSNDDDGDEDPVFSEDSSPAPSNSCGLDEQDRIYGGQITDLDEFPWMALMGYRTRDGRTLYQCGGVLVNHRYVLTASHCVVGQIKEKVGTLSTVRLGEYDIEKDVDCLNEQCAPRPQEIPVQSSYAHPGFADTNVNRKDDIALVRLAKRAQYSYYVQPICLMDSRVRLDVGNSVYVAGWGKTLSGKSSTVKLKLAVPVYDKNQCINKYRPLGATLTSNQICAGGNFAQDTCRGDSGGPLMRKKANGVWEAVGIVSFGNGCGKDGWPGVYTSVAGYLDWIRTTMRSSNV